MSAAPELPLRWVDSHLVTHPEMDQRTDDWHDQRRGMVTASVVGRLISVRRLGADEVSCPACEAPALSPCRSKVKRAGEIGAPIKQAHGERAAAAASLDDEVIGVASGDEARGLAAHLAAERIAGFTEEGYVSFDMMRGVECEPLAIEKYSEHYKVPVESCGFMVRSWGAKGLLRLGYSPDGLVGNDGLVEVKTRRGKKQVLTVVNDEVPAENMAQIQAGLFVSGREWLDYISYSGGLPLWTKRIFPDPRWFNALAAAVEASEQAITEMVAAFNKGTAGMPMTERLETDMEMVL